MTCRAQQFGRYLEVEGYSMTLQKNHVWAIIIILKLFHRNEHHIESPCCEQHLGRYLKGQGHSMTLQQKGVRPITLLFEVGFYNYLTEMIIILRCVTTLPIVWLCVYYIHVYTALY